MPKCIMRHRSYLLVLFLCFLPSNARSSDSIAASPEIIHTFWYSHSEQLYRRVDIYIPEPSSDRPYPVLYLIHGINGYEGSWQERGQAVDTLCKKIAEGRCEPMILVMPDCNKWPFRPHPGNKNLWHSLLHYGQISHEHKIDRALCDLMDMVDSTYCVSEECVFAGLSDGARLAANVANLQPDRVTAVGLFSPVLHKEQLPLPTLSACRYTVYVGNNDIFQPNGKRFDKRLQRRNYPQHRLVVFPGSHNWKIWRRCLSDFLENL